MSSEDEKHLSIVDEKGGHDVDVVETASAEDLRFEDAAVTNGAPIEKVSPLGYHVDWITVVLLVRFSRPVLAPCYLTVDCATRISVK